MAERPGQEPEQPDTDEDYFVSVVLPTYQRAASLGNAIRSVLRQSHRTLELVVVDDGSTDDTTAVVESFQDPRLEYILSSENRGANHARNVGIEASSGEVVAFLDSDDIWRPRKLERQLERLQRDDHGDVGAVYTDFWQVTESGRERAHETRRPDDGDIQSQLLAGNGSFVTTSVLLARRECLEAVGGFDERLPRLQEWELCLRLAAEYEFAYVPEPLVYKHMVFDEVSISSDEEALLWALEYIITKHRDVFSRHPDQLAKHQHRLGRFHFADQQPSKARQWLLRAVRTYPALPYVAALCAGLLGGRVYRLFHALYTRSLLS